MADIIFNEIEEEIIQSFDQMTKEQQRDRLALWTLEIYNWINKARAYIAFEQSLANKLSDNSKQSLDNVKEILRARRVAKKMINNKQILTEGYVLLNKIGETIRGEEVLYSVTISKTGKALSTGSIGTEGVYTWKVPLKEFLTMLNFTSQRIVLKDSSALYKMLEKQIEENNKVVYEKWTEEKLQQFAIFNSQVRTNPKWSNWHKINEGNMLEAFLRFLDDGGTPTRMANPNYWHMVGSAVKRTMSAPDPFFLGGDLNEFQIKGLNASVTNINTLIQNLEKVLMILRMSYSGHEVLKKYYRANVANQIQQETLKTQEEIANELINFFTSKIER